MKRHPLVMFFVLAFALPWFVWGTTLAENAGVITWHIPESLAFWVGLPIATYGVAALTGGWPAVKDLLLRLIRVKAGPAWYLAALAIPVLIVALVIGLGATVGQPAAVGTALPVGALAGTLAFNAWMWLITEETAWRGFALPRLQQRFNPLVASLLLGLLWALWHLPLFFIPDSFQSGIPFAGFLVSTMATSVIVGWIFNGARGSVLIAALFHAVTDVAIAFSGVMTSGATLFWVTVIVQVVAAAAVARSLAAANPASAPQTVPISVRQPGPQ